MRFFCTQPDIVEDVQAVRYNTHTSKSKSSAAGPTSSAAPPPRVVFNAPITDTANLNRSRTNLHNVFGAKKFFHTHSLLGHNHHHNNNGESTRKLSIGAPIPITTPNINAVAIVAPATAPPVPASYTPGVPAVVKPTSYDGRAKNLDIKPKSYSGENKALTDTEGLGFRRKTRRMSAPFTAALKLSGGGEESGTDTGGGKKTRRVSKMAIGAPGEFRHEGGANFNATPPEHDTWNVETWRAEIERTLTHTSAASHTASRPKGPRPSSGSPDPSPRKNRGSLDGAAPAPGAPRWSAESKRDRDGLARWSSERERDGTVSDYPIGRPMTGPHRGSVSSNTSGRHSRSRSGSQNQTQPPQIVGIHTNRGPRLALGDGQTVLGHVHGHGHVPGKESITSLASTPTTVTTLSSNNTIITPTTTTTSLNRSLSDKPYYHHPPHHPVHARSNVSPQSGNGDREWKYASGNENNHHLQRASSANAVVPTPATARYPPSSSASSYASHASSTTTATRRPIPTPRRKPVPQHLPATAEVSPFPTLLVVKDSSSPTNPSFPFDVNRGDKKGSEEEEKRKGWRDESGKVKKEMVPLLGVPTDGAQYVTKSTKARWDGAMAEIASALRDPNAPLPPPH